MTQEQIEERFPLVKALRIKKANAALWASVRAFNDAHEAREDTERGIMFSAISSALLELIAKTPVANNCSVPIAITKALFDCEIPFAKVEFCPHQAEYLKEKETKL